MRFKALTQIEKNNDCPYVIASVHGKGTFGSMPRAWKRTIERAQLPGGILTHRWRVIWVSQNPRLPHCSAILPDR
jgi:hypothetical protein